MINIEMLTETFGGDKEFVIMIFTQYLSDNSDVNDRILEQYEAQQFENLFHTMHTLSGALSNICEEDAVSTIKKVENLSRNGESPDMADINFITTELDKIKAQMEQFLG